MTLYYSAQNNGFYDDEIHTKLPPDCVAITREKHLQLLEAQSQGKIISADREGNPIAEEPARASLEDYKKAARAKNDERRREEERKGHTYTFPDGIEDVIQIRDDRDLINVNAQVTAAQLMASSGITDPVMPFQALSNATHLMTPAQVVTMGMSVSRHITSLYQTAWAVKQAIEAATTYEEVDEASQWPEPV